MQDADPSAWASAVMPWIGAGVLLATAAAALGTWVLVQRVRDLERAAGRLDVLQDLKSALGRIAAEREDIDLRRMEHALIEIRDALKRTEEALLRAAQAPRAVGAAEAPGGGANLAERVTNRLLALGYDRVQLVTTLAELERLPARGEILVEARRDGVACKGRVLLENGALTDVEMKPAYAMFP